MFSALSDFIGTLSIGVVANALCLVCVLISILLISCRFSHLVYFLVLVLMLRVTNTLFALCCIVVLLLLITRLLIVHRLV